MEQQNTSKPKPQEIPKETYAPLLLAVSVAFICWGLLSTWIISVTGVIGFFIALAEWIKEMLYERTED